jgi:hypothetical protein
MRYKMTNQTTGEVVEVEAPNLPAAFKAQGWGEDVTAFVEILPDIPAAAAKKTKGKKKSTEGSPPAAGQHLEGTEVEVSQTTVQEVVGVPSEAEKTAYEHKQQIEALAIEAEVMFLRMGQLLFNAQKKGEWTVLHYESYKEYIVDLKLPMTNSYSWATRLSNIYEYLVLNMKLDEKLLAEIGVAKLTRLLPLARKGELTEAVIEAARVLSDLDLRAELGHNVGGGSETEMLVICPRCGDTFDARKANRP